MCSDSLARYLLRRKGSQGFTKNISWKCSIQSSSAVFSVFQRSNGSAHLHLMPLNYNPDLKFARKQYSSFHHWHDYQGGLKPRRKTRSSYDSYGAYHSIISVTGEAHGKTVDSTRLFLHVAGQVGQKSSVLVKIVLGEFQVSIFNSVNRTGALILYRYPRYHEMYKTEAIQYQENICQCQQVTEADSAQLFLRSLI